MDFFVCIFVFGIEEVYDVGVMGVEIDSFCFLLCIKLVGIGKGVF